MRTMLWERIKANKVTVAYVCNRAENGDHYWVLATIIPLDQVDPSLIEALLDRAFEPGRHKRTAYIVRDGVDWLPGLSFAALNGALDLIRDLGGGIVESYPQDTQGKKTSNSFLYNSTRQIFERAGFSYEGKKGKNHCIMRKTI